MAGETFVCRDSRSRPQCVILVGVCIDAFAVTVAPKFPLCWTGFRFSLSWRSRAVQSLCEELVGIASTAFRLAMKNVLGGYRSVRNLMVLFGTLELERLSDGYHTQSEIRGAAKLLRIA